MLNANNIAKIYSSPTTQKAYISMGLCALVSIFLVYAVSITRSLVITGLTWISVFSLFAAASTIISFVCKSRQIANKKYTFGIVRAPVLAVFSTTVLAQLSAVFLTKEAVERLFDSGQHHHFHGGEAANIQNDEVGKLNYLFYPAAFASSISLLIVAYGFVDQPFNYVLKHAHASIIQEHASDISAALCYFVPGLARILLPRINSLTLIALISTCCAAFVHWFRAEFAWVDSAAALALSFVVFTSMMPLSIFTGRILLQTTPPHVQNQIDRLISEASTVDGVLELINAHFWQLDFSTIAGTVDVRLRRDADEQRVLRNVHNKLTSVVNICTIQLLKDPSTTWAAHSHQHHLHQQSPTYGGNPQMRLQQQPMAAMEQHNHNHHNNEAGHGHSHDGGHGHSHHHH